MRNLLFSLASSSSLRSALLFLHMFSAQSVAAGAHASPVRRREVHPDCFGRYLESVVQWAVGGETQG